MEQSPEHPRQQIPPCPRLARPSVPSSVSTKTLAAWPHPLPCVLREDQEQDVATTPKAGSDVNLAAYPELCSPVKGLQSSSFLTVPCRASTCD